MLDRQVALKFLHERFAQDAAVRRALPPRGAGRRRAPAPERRRRLRPRRGRRAPLHRDGVRRGRDAQGPDRPRALGRRGGGDRPPDPRRGAASPTSAGSSTATSSRRTCSSTPRAAPGSTDFGIARAGRLGDHRDRARCSAPRSTSRPSRPRASRSPPPSDLYSVGVILYEALTGRVPFDAETPVAVALKQVSEQPRAAASSTRRCRRRSTPSSCARWPRTPRTASHSADEFLARARRRRGRPLRRRARRHRRLRAGRGGAPPAARRRRRSAPPPEDAGGWLTRRRVDRARRDRAARRGVAACALTRPGAGRPSRR